MKPREQTDKRIPLIDLRRIALYGECHSVSPLGRPSGKPCSNTSHHDDVHFAACPQAPHSRAGIVLEWR